MKILETKLKLIETTEEYIQENKRNNQQQNLPKNEKEGLKSLKEKEDIVIFSTDKSGRFATDTKENYEEACNPHTNKDQIISEEEHIKCQKTINAHAIMWTKMLKMGKNEKSNNAENRIKTNVTIATGSHGTASLYSLRKDHKYTDNQEKGPPVRPVCSGNEGYNNKLSHRISKIIRPLWKESDTCCENTEEILADIKELNEKRINEDIIVGSLDVKALYPSLDINFTAEIVSKEFYENEYELEGIDVEEVGLYLGIEMSEKEQEEKGIRKFCCQRKNKMGRKPLITGQATTSNSQETRFKAWEKPECTPEKKDVKKMIAEALEITIKFIMKNHIYEFKNTLRKQTSGGPIGLELTGDLAQVFMNWWDRQMKMRLMKENIILQLYKRYVDDINVAATNNMKQITNKDDGKGKLNEQRNQHTRDEKRERKEEEEKMMNKIKDIGNSIHHSIQLEVDYPSLHEDNKLPLLDIKIWTEKEGDQQDERKHQTREGEQEDKTDETDPKKVFQKEENKKRTKI